MSFASSAVAPLCSAKSQLKRVTVSTNSSATSSSTSTARIKEKRTKSNKIPTIVAMKISALEIAWLGFLLLTFYIWVQFLDSLWIYFREELLQVLAVHDCGTLKTIQFNKNVTSIFR